MTANANSAIPIERRDKKSGDKKRKQAEIELAEREAANVDDLGLTIGDTCAMPPWIAIARNQGRCRSGPRIWKSRRTTRYN